MKAFAGFEELNHSCYSPDVVSRRNTCIEISFQAMVNDKVLFRSGLRSNDFCISGISPYSPVLNLMLRLELVQFQVEALETQDMNVLP
jgi:hypothetical protein